MKVLLVCMPWAAVETPSLALGILKREVSELDDVDVSTIYANIDYVELDVRPLAVHQRRANTRLQLP